MTDKVSTMMNVEYYDEVRRNISNPDIKATILDQLGYEVDALIRRHETLANIQLQYINNSFTVHREIKDREGFLAEAVLYTDADTPEVYEFLKEYILLDAASQLGL